MYGNIYVIRKYLQSRQILRYYKSKIYFILQGIPILTLNFSQSEVLVHVNIVA